MLNYSVFNEIQIINNYSGGGKGGNACHYGIAILFMLPVWRMA
jgi:hypothetical protein